MIRILVLGLSTLLLSSCKSVKYSEFGKKNQFLYHKEQPSFHFKNDNLKIGATWYHFTGMMEDFKINDFKRDVFPIQPFDKKKLSLIGYMHDNSFSVQKNGVVFYQIQDDDKTIIKKKGISYISPFNKIRSIYFDTVFKKENIFSRTFVFNIDSTKLAFQVFASQKYTISGYKEYSFELIDSLHLSNEYNNIYNFNLHKYAYDNFKNTDSLPNYFYFKSIYEDNNSYYKNELNEKYIRLNMLKYANSFYHNLDEIRNLQMNTLKTDKIDLRISPIPLLKNKIKNHLKKDLLSSSVIEDDISEMFTKIKNTKVLIINENKYDWRNRYHVSSLLDTLQKMGYHTISMEALYESDTIKNKKLPLLNDGFNTLEPAMTNLIRKAKKENWNILNYNYDNDIFDTISKRYPNISGREWSQAIHLVEYIKNNPNEKILIYSGGSQMYNKNQDKAQMRLAEILNKFWEIKPVTIDQTYFNDLDVNILPNNNEINPFRYYKKEKFLRYDSILFNSFRICALFGIGKGLFSRENQTFLD
jgi:hypothetical protein